MLKKKPAWVPICVATKESAQAFAKKHWALMCFNSEKKWNHTTDFQRIAPLSLVDTSVLLDTAIYSGEFAKHRWVKGLAHNNRSHMMDILISISAPSHQLISGKGGSTQKNTHTLPAHHDFQPHINLKIHLLDIWYLRF